MPELLQLAAASGKAAKQVMPWAMKNPRREDPVATPDEIATAEADLEAGIVFS